ncbi:M20/M25/M40 family metallo-hydrolase [Caldalkalibacillus mannanilyticus]|uniref:M20/M25/M40 family metallo-hydrolase n=1 Tax=Caldalkalibacillus mannanilyticus TaxID=1418 RepID=UPI00046904B7|nr:M20/M25/M40 family metallo-hydrolase [Caldalkalibacillus mannanilyticus]
MQVNRQEIEQLLKDLIHQSSIVNTDGERKIAENIYRYISALPYFQERPDQVELSTTYNDSRHRYNVLAYVKGEATVSNETVILMGHMDTVGTSDFGKWQEIANDPDRLKEIYQKEGVPNEIREHALSSDWMFGRGSLDMKSGVASHLYLLKHFAEHPKELKGNLLVLIECDEEDSSNGIRSALKDLRRIKDREDFEYIAAINSDYTSPRFQGDENRYIYTGTVGKLLPTFFIAGKETHVGQVFEGFDPNLIISELTKEIDYNPLLSDEMHGEWTLPPVSLKQTDLKPFYDVQTPLSAFVYYNFFVHSWSPKEVLDRLEIHANRAFEQAIRTYSERYELYCKLSGEPYKPVQIKPRVYSFEKYYTWLKEEHGEAFEKEIGKLCEKIMKEPDMDIRKFSCRVVDEIWRWDQTKEPVIILFYSNIYYPRVAFTEDSVLGNRLLQAIDSAVDHVQPYHPKQILSRQFFPYISDMSFMAVSDDDESLAYLDRNMPTWGEEYRLNVEDIKALNVPVCNIGPYGFDAHKKYERVELSYSLEIVPFLTYSVIRRLCK